MIAESHAIKFSVFGLDLLEPNVLLTDFLLGIICLVFAYRISRLPAKHPFFRNWYRFLFFFGIGAILGGLGHVFANYWGIQGKMPAWILSALAVYFIEFSMFSVLKNENWFGILTKIALGKLVIVIMLILLIAIFAQPHAKVDLCILVIIINSLVGVIFSAGILGWAYYRLGYSKHFRRIVGGVLIIVPASAIFLLDFNLFRWFDRNDLSHLIIILGINAFYQSVIRLYRDNPTLQRNWNSD